jgi:RimJ/RimL family protein N-acetyltransferase
MAFGIEGKRVRLVPYDPDRHFENFYRWINDPDLTDTLGILGTPFTQNDQAEVMKKLTSMGTYFAIETLEGVHLGSSSIFNINQYDRTGVTGSFIGLPDQRGKGFGTEASILRARYAFDQLNLRLLKSEYQAENRASELMQLRTGYIEYGRLENAVWKSGNYRTMVFTALTRERFFEMHGTSK